MTDLQNKFEQQYYIAWPEVSGVKTERQESVTDGWVRHIVKFPTGWQAAVAARQILQDILPSWIAGNEVAYQKPVTEHELFGEGTFTRSNGGVVSRLYERLTKASRRRDTYGERWEMAYRRGVYDAFKALQKELS